MVFEFDVHKHIISILKPNLLNKYSVLFSNQFDFNNIKQTYFIIEDPSNISNNVGKNVRAFTFNHIRQECKRALYLLISYSKQEQQEKQENGKNRCDCDPFEILNIFCAHGLNLDTMDFFLM